MENSVCKVIEVEEWVDPRTGNPQWILIHDCGRTTFMDKVPIPAGGGKTDIQWYPAPDYILCQ